MNALELLEEIKKQQLPTVCGSSEVKSGTLGEEPDPGGAKI
jgi:hypothetical protein